MTMFRNPNSPESTYDTLNVINLLLGSVPLDWSEICHPD